LAAPVSLLLPLFPTMTLASACRAVDVRAAGKRQVLDIALGLSCCRKAVEAEADRDLQIDADSPTLVDNVAVSSTT
jgi:hypothetical protein